MNFVDQLFVFILLLISGAFYWTRKSLLKRAEKAESQNVEGVIHDIEEKNAKAASKRTAGDILLELERRYGDKSHSGDGDSKG